MDMSVPQIVNLTTNETTKQSVWTCCRQEVFINWLAGFHWGWLIDPWGWGRTAGNEAHTTYSICTQTLLTLIDMYTGFVAFSYERRMSLAAGPWPCALQLTAAKLHSNRLSQCLGLIAHKLMRENVKLCFPKRNLVTLISLKLLSAILIKATVIDHSITCLYCNWKHWNCFQRQR